ncbi:MAG: fumarylacetoacetate hydrolase family protein [Halobacteriales archaeon]
MRYLARSGTGDPLLGDEDGIVPLSAAIPAADSLGDALRMAPDGLPDTGAGSAVPVPPEGVSFASPIADPGKLLGIGLNYVDHADDLKEEPPDEPASFFKPASALTGPGGPIRLPPREISDRVTAEAELAVVVGRTCTDITAGGADDVIAGYLPVIDVTAEDVLARNPRFLTRAKSFDTFLVPGPRLVVDAGFDIADVEVRTIVNGDTVAENAVANMQYSPRELVAFHSRVMTLRPGDIISTGTPGAGVIGPGDTARAEVDPVGDVTASVVL